MKFKVCVIWNIKPRQDEKEICLLRMGLGDQVLKDIAEWSFRFPTSLSWSIYMLHTLLGIGLGRIIS